MKILAIETSCDETSAAIIFKESQENSVKLLSNVVASSLVLHSKTGGIVPEQAAREQIKYIIPVIKKAIENCKLKIENLDAIAVTIGPGLIGSLLVGVETAKTLAYLWKKPIIPVNHLPGHIYANWLKTKDHRPKTIEFPALALLVSGGHTDLVIIKNHKIAKWIGGTLDDAAGEAFDKIGRLLNLPYPGGPSIEKEAKKGNPKSYSFPRPMIYSKNFDFSFSGLKAAVRRHVILNKVKNPRDPSASPQDDIILSNICASVQQAIIDVLVSKTLKAVQQYKVKSILLGGGVAANQKLCNEFQLKIENLKLQITLSVPPKNLCTDNAAMIGAYAAFNYKPVPWQKITANPELHF